jgi:uncharacterized protein (TIGR03437 family)
MMPLCAFATIAATQTYNIETLAGSDFKGDGLPAVEAVLLQPRAVIADRSGTVFFSDAADNRVWKITAGMLYSVAGTGVRGFRGDRGPASQAQLASPYGLALDRAGNLYIADLGNAVVRCVAADGTISTVAGGGQLRPLAGPPVDALQVRLDQPRDLAVDNSGNLFISDFAAHRVYQVSPAGSLSVVAGTDELRPAQDGAKATDVRLSSPAGLAVDSFGNLFIADSGSKRILRITAGYLWLVSDRTGKPLKLAVPTGVAIDPAGSLFIADGSGSISIRNAAGDLSQLAMGSVSVSVGSAGEIYATDRRVVSRFAGGSTEIIAGGGSAAAVGDNAPRPEWRFKAPMAAVRDRASGYVYVADTLHGRIRRISPAGVLTTITTELREPVALAFDSQGRLYASDRAAGAIYRIAPTGRAELFAQGSENRPVGAEGIAFDREDRLYVADTRHQVIRRVAPDGSLTVVAGGGNNTGDGQALLLELASPVGLAPLENGDVLFSEAASGRIRRLKPSGVVETLSGPTLLQPRGIRLLDDGSLLVADAGQHRVLRLAQDGTWTPVAGSGDQGFSGDGGPALSAMLNAPHDVSVDADGSILIADVGNNRIRLLRPDATVEPEGPPPAAITMAELTARHAATRDARPLAPGQLALISAEGLDLSGLEITFGGIKAQVLAVDDGIATVRVPSTVPLGSVSIAAQDATSALAEGTADITPMSPGLLTQSGASGAAALNEDGTLNSEDRPAPRGSIVSLYLTGEGGGNATVFAEIGRYFCDVVWTGPAPGLPGLWQVNVRTPSGYVAGGVQPVVLTVNGVRTQSGVTLATE